jgi:hypothetical protein
MIVEIALGIALFYASIIVIAVFWRVILAIVAIIAGLYVCVFAYVVVKELRPSHTKSTESWTTLPESSMVEDRRNGRQHNDDRFDQRTFDWTVVSNTVTRAPRALPTRPRPARMD